MLSARELCQIVGPHMSLDYVRLLVRDLDKGPDSRLPVFYKDHISGPKPYRFSFGAVWLFFLADRISMRTGINFTHACRITRSLDQYDGSSDLHQIFSVFTESAMQQDLCIIYSDADFYSQKRAKKVKPFELYEIQLDHVGVFQIALRNATEEQKIKHARKTLENILGREGSLIIMLNSIRADFLLSLERAGFCFHFASESQKIPFHKRIEISPFKDWQAEYDCIDDKPFSHSLLSMIEGIENDD